jgi:hypothetical protein
MFSTKFVRLPIRVHNKDQNELMGTDLEIDTYEMVNPFTISSYRPSVEPEGMTYVSFKDGSGMMVYMDINEFEVLMNNHPIFKL